MRGIWLKSSSFIRFFFPFGSVAFMTRATKSSSFHHLYQ